jgi:hypothetical protein
MVRMSSRTFVPLILFGGKFEDTARDRLETVHFSLQHKCECAAMATATLQKGPCLTKGFPLEKPRYADSPISVPLFGGILVRVGSFVEVDINGSLLVAQVSQKQDPESKLIRVNLFRSVDGSDLQASIPCLSGIAQDTAEVFQTDEYHEIECGDITNISYVFSPSEMERNGYVIQGVSNAYVCRYQADGNLKVYNYCFPTDVPNYCPLQSCYQERIWSSLEHIRAILHKALNKMSEKQGVKYMEKCFFPHESWVYIKAQVRKALFILQEKENPDGQDSDDEDRWLTVKNHCARMKIRRTGPGLYRFSTWDESKTELLRFEVDEDLQVFRSIFNMHSMHGIRDRSPKILEKSLKLSNNTALNVVMANSERREKLAKYPCEDGVDLNYSTKWQVLEIRVRYTRMVYRASNGVVTTQLPRYILGILGAKRLAQLEEAASRNEESFSDQLSVGQFFGDDLGNFFRVVRVDGNDVYVRNTSRSARRTVERMDVETVLQMAASTFNLD